MIARKVLGQIETRLANTKTTYKQPLNVEQCHEILLFMAHLADCGVLQTRSEGKAASTIVDWLRLPSHHDSQKNWDTVKALFHILKLNAPELPVLDAGAGTDSVILKWLSKLGYRELYSCDIRPHITKKNAHIHFSVQDITQTNYPDSLFQAVTCISVIEHGISIEAYLKEMSRILRPGGVLLTSTDYWSEPIDCRGIYPYGEKMGEMKVFQPHEIKKFCQTAERCGFSLCSQLKLNTTDRAVHWDRVNRDFTFAFIALNRL